MQLSCQTAIWMLCAKDETLFSMCMRCITYRHLLQGQLLHFTSSCHLGHFHSSESCCPLRTPEMSPTRVLSEGQVALISWLPHLMLSIPSTEHFRVEGVQACFTDILMEVQKSLWWDWAHLHSPNPKTRNLIRTSHLGSLYSQWWKTGTSTAWFILFFSWTTILKEVELYSRDACLSAWMIEEI